MLYIIFIFELFILYFSYYIVLYSYVFYVPRSDAARAFSMVKALHLALLVDSSLTDCSAGADLMHDDLRTYYLCCD